MVTIRVDLTENEAWLLCKEIELSLSGQVSARTKRMLKSIYKKLMFLLSS